MAKEILVLGANSFIGKKFLQDYQEKEIVGTVRSDFSFPEKKVTIVDHFDYSFKGLLELLALYVPQRIINFVGARSGEFDHLLEVNFLITQRLLEAVREIKGYNPKIVLIGSAAEYGVSNASDKAVFTEDSPARPTSAYGLTKLMQTEIGLYYYRVYGQRINIARLANVIGFGLPKGFLLSDIIEQIKEGKEVIVVGDLSSVRDFIEVGEVVEGLKKIFEQETSGEVINLCSGKGTVLREIKTAITDYFREKENREVCIEEKSPTSSKPNYSVLDNTKLFNLTRFKPSQYTKELIIKFLQETFS